HPHREIPNGQGRADDSRDQQHLRCGCRPGATDRRARMRTPWEASVFVYRDDQVLLMHRTDDRYWHVVAGVVEYGEAIADAARRELREESGLIGAELVDLGSPVTYPITPELRQRYDYPADSDAVTVYSFAAEAPSGWEPTLN